MTTWRGPKLTSSLPFNLNIWQVYCGPILMHLSSDEDMSYILRLFTLILNVENLKMNLKDV